MLARVVLTVGVLLVSLAPAFSATVVAGEGKVVRYVVDPGTGHIVTAKMDTNDDGFPDQDVQICNPSQAWDERVNEAFEGQHCISFETETGSNCVEEWIVGGNC